MFDNNDSETGVEYKTNKESLVEDQIVFGALMGLDVIIVLQLMTLARLDKPLSVALYCFVVAIPLLAMYVLSILTTMKYEYDVWVWYHLAAILAGGLASLAGVGALFFHFSWVAGGLFALLSVLGLGAYFHYNGQLKKLNELHNSKRRQ